LRAERLIADGQSLTVETTPKSFGIRCAVSINISKQATAQNKQLRNTGILHFVQNNSKSNPLLALIRQVLRRSLFVAGLAVAGGDEAGDPEEGALGFGVG
jgi:hypothetical protein